MPAEEKSVSTGVGFRTKYVEVSPGLFAPVVVVASAMDSGTTSGAVTVADGADVTFGKKDDAAAAADGTAASYMSLFRRLLGKFPISIGPKTAAGALAVTLATDDAAVGAKVSAVSALGAGGSGIVGWLSAIWQANATVSNQLPATIGGKASANALAVTLASDDAAIGTKVTAVPALASGGTGLIGWLSAQWQALINLGNQLPATIGPKTNALSLSVTPATDANIARETYTTVTPLSTPTLAVGANFNPLQGLACSMVELINNTAVDIEYRRNALTNYIPVMAGTSRMVQGITNANQIAIRRIDQSATIATIPAEAFTV